MSAWLESGLLGTARRAPPATAPGVPPEVSPALRVLLHVGGDSLRRRAGARTSAAGPLPPPAPSERRAVCSAALARLLRELLACPRWRGLALFACGWVAAAGLRLPERALPAALAVRDPALRAALRPLLGARGRWLAELRADWSWAREAGPELVRAAAAEAVRGNDAAAEHRAQGARAVQAVADAAPLDAGAPVPPPAERTAQLAPAGSSVAAPVEALSVERGGALLALRAPGAHPARVLSAVPGPWSVPLGRLFLRLLGEVVRCPERRALAPWCALLGTVSWRLPPALWDVRVAHVRPAASAASSSIRAFGDALRGFHHQLSVLCLLAKELPQ